MAHFRVLRGVLTAAGNGVPRSVSARDGPLCRRSERGVWKKRRTGHPDPLQIIGRNEGMISPHAAHVNHGSVVGHLHGLADAGFSAFHHLQLVHCVVHTEGIDFVTRKPLPATERRVENPITEGIERGNGERKADTWRPPALATLHLSSLQEPDYSRVPGSYSGCSRPRGLSQEFPRHGQVLQLLKHSPRISAALAVISSPGATTFV